MTRPAGPAWKLVWSDEFDQPGVATIDPAKWKFELGMIRNREAQLYTDRAENVRIEDGCLVIEARKERVPIPNKPGTFAEYTAGSVETFSKAAWTHGRLEVRAKIPRGWGMWPAVWLMGTDIPEVGWPTCGEIDVMENVGYEPEKIHASIHVKGEGPDGKEVSETTTAVVEQLTKEFHVYAMEWDAKQVRIFVDDRKYFSYDRFDAKGNEKPWPFDKPLYLKLNFAVGGTWGGKFGIDDSAFPQKFVIDYVRVYQKPD
jgi:beta-glucanase (GH16 family)